MWTQANLNEIMLCAINFDGNWDSSDNKKNLYRTDISSIKPVAYYSIAETTTHYLILYCFYHADDSTHENDLEGCLVIVKKEEPNDILQGIVTVAHSDFWPFSVKGRLEIVESQLDRYLDSRKSSKYVMVEDYRDNEHPAIKSEPKKHGLYAWCSDVPDKLAKTFGGLPNVDTLDNIGIRYVPGSNHDPIFEDSINSFSKTTREYALIDMLGEDGFWIRRYDKKLFKTWGVFNKSLFARIFLFLGGNANAPWKWDDQNDAFYPGAMIYDPAGLVQNYFHGFDNFETGYLKTMLAQ